MFFYQFYFDEKFTTNKIVKIGGYHKTRYNFEYSLFLEEAAARNIALMHAVFNVLEGAEDFRPYILGVNMVRLMLIMWCRLEVLWILGHAW